MAKPLSTRISPIVCLGARRRSVGLPGLRIWKPSGACSWSGMWEWPKTTDVRAVAEAAAHPLEAAGARAGVVDHRDPRAVRLHHPLLRQQPAQVGAVHVPVHAHHRRPDRLQLAEHLERREVAGVQEQVGGSRSARRTPPAAAARPAAGGCRI